MSERLACLLGTFGVHFRAPLKPLDTIVQGFQGVHNRPLMMPRYASLSDSYKSDRCCFISIKSIPQTAFTETKLNLYTIFTTKIKQGVVPH